MRATVALKRKPDGSFCQLDVRGNSKLTPSFVKSAHRKASAPKSDTPVCSKSDIKVFQKGAKKLNLKGAKGQKTSVGALLGTLAKSAGVGCVFGAGIAWVSDMWRGKSNDEKTEAGSSCVDCANQKSKEEKEVKDLKTTTRSILAGGAAGGLIGITTPTHLAIAREVRRENIMGKIADTAMYPDKVKDKIKQLTSEINNGESKMNELNKKISELKRNRNLMSKDAYKKELKMFKEQRFETRINTSKLQSRKVFWTQLDGIHSLKPSRLRPQTLREIGLADRIMPEVTRRLTAISREELLQDIKTNPEVKKRIEKIKSPTSQLGKLVSGIVGGVAGAIVCEDGTTYLLSKEKIEDI